MVAREEQNVDPGVGQPQQGLQRACDEGWPSACDNLAMLSLAADKPRAREFWERACERGHGMSCQNLGIMLHLGDGEIGRAHV